jgi:hypothetical protein
MNSEKKEGIPKVSEVFESVKRERTLIEKILSVFPGYKGYKEKELLRETDKLIRNVVFRNMKEISERIRTLYREALNISSLSQETHQLEKLSMRSDALAEKIHHATYGYSPLMHVIKIDEKALLRLMEFDAGLADNINKLKEVVKNMEGELAFHKLSLESIRKIESIISILENTFNKRSEVLLGIVGDSYVY